MLDESNLLRTETWLESYIFSDSDDTIRRRGEAPKSDIEPPQNNRKYSVENEGHHSKTVFLSPGRESKVKERNHHNVDDTKKELGNALDPFEDLRTFTLDNVPRWVQDILLPNAYLVNNRRYIQSQTRTRNQLQIDTKLMPKFGLLAGV